MNEIEAIYFIINKINFFVSKTIPWINIIIINLIILFIGFIIADLLKNLIEKIIRENHKQFNELSFIISNSIKIIIYIITFFIILKELFGINLFIIILSLIILIIILRLISYTISLIINLIFFLSKKKLIKKKIKELNKYLGKDSIIKQNLKGVCCVFKEKPFRILINYNYLTKIKLR